MLESLFNKVAGLKTSNFVKKRLQHRWHEKETTEGVVRRYSSKQVFLKISQISQENTGVGALTPATLLRRDSKKGVLR